mmetsp:Transcript_35954/g.112918  ORF Transcript_35954/g.112918 Transcript_35954/m.112918 type:complete len:379 (+) Transcript_35954:1573-2709(+)
MKQSALGSVLVLAFMFGACGVHLSQTRLALARPLALGSRLRSSSARPWRRSMAFSCALLIAYVSERALAQGQQGAPLGPGAGILSYLDDVHVFGPVEFAAKVARAFAQQSKAVAPGMKLTKVVGFAAGARTPPDAWLPPGADACEQQPTAQLLQSQRFARIFRLVADLDPHATHLLTTCDVRAADVLAADAPADVGRRRGPGTRCVCTGHAPGHHGPLHPRRRPRGRRPGRRWRGHRPVGSRGLSGQPAAQARRVRVPLGGAPRARRLLRVPDPRRAVPPGAPLAPRGPVRADHAVRPGCRCLGPVGGPRRQRSAAVLFEGRFPGPRSERHAVRPAPGGPRPHGARASPAADCGLDPAPPGSGACVRPGHPESDPRRP